MGDVLSDSRSHVPSEPDVPETVHVAVCGALYAGHKAALSALSRKIAGVQAIEKPYRAQLERLLARPGYAAVRKYLASLDAEMLDRVFPADGCPSEQQMARLRAERNETAQAYLERRGVDPERLAALNDATRKSIARTMRPPLGRYDRRPVQILKPEQVPEDIRTGRTNPWTTKTPPYPGWAWSYTGYIAGFSFTPTLYLDSAAGFAGNINYLKDSSAGDFDYGYVRYDTQVGMWYKMPSAGIVEVWVEAQPTECQHYCSLYNAWGWSDSSVYQRNYITLQVNGGGIRTSSSSYWYENGYASGHWNNRYLTTAASYWHHLYSTGAYAKDQWVLVNIGTRNWNDCFANDVSTYSEVDFRWFIKRVYIRVKP